MAAFQAPQRLLQEVSLVLQWLKEAPECLSGAAAGWRAELEATRALLKGQLFGPRVFLVGRPGSGKTALLNALVGWDLLPLSAAPAGSHAECLRALRSVELQVLPPAGGSGREEGSDDGTCPGRMDISVQLMSPQE
eukprot:CAMPEP_0117684066 /NCGR_PEP_ID=MMETSP0804-20121206/20848_1 /TAXON_ID=1074897 /ORGANISM="Tetraselmis astigmatica, Strain CCMP880" /LENGTH=135 /DNA_ID=CAMNT_0005494927 /DNA_START=121 /DNA_END=525 /DNA_ORIENTATION=+